MAVDILYLYDKQENFIGTLSNKNSSMCPFFTDNRYERLDNTASTIEFKTLLKHSSGIPSKIENEGFVVFKDRDSKFVQYKIIIAEEDRTSRQLYVLAVGSWIELTKEMIEPFENVKLSAKQQLDYFLQNTRWRAGQVAYNGVKTMSSDKMMTVLEATQRLRTTFELEPRFRIEMGVNGEITGRYCDLLERRGIVHPNRFEIGKDVQLLRRKIDTTELVTALYGYGQQAEGSNVDAPLDFSGVQWSKANGDPANKPIGQKWVGSDEALAKYGGKDKKHKFGVHESQVQGDANSLLQHTWEVLQRRSTPKVTYEVDLAVLGDVGIGDTINIVDQKDEDNELYLEARVLELEGPISEDKKGKAILGNYRELQKPDVDSKIKQLEKILGERLLSLVIASITSSAGNIFKNGIGTTELTANAFLSGLEYDADGTKYTYTWSKHDKTGNLVPSFIKTGKTITVTASEIDEKATYVVTVKNDKVSIPAEITISNVYDGADGKDGKDGKDGEQGPQGPQGVQGPKGADGQSLYTWVKYADSPTSGMSDYPTNKKYIGLAYNKTTPAESTNYADYQWAKIEGDQGAPGAPGTTTYTWVKYADDDKGAGMSDSPVGKRYLGLAYNKTTQTESSNPADYSWSPLYDNVQVGGVNLINDSKFRDKPKNVSHITLTTSGLKQGEYTISFDYEVVEENITFEKFLIYAGAIVGYVPLKNVGENRTKLTFKINATTGNKPILLYFGKNFAESYENHGIFKEIQIEKGNIATTYSPSIADVEADAQAKANEAEQNANTYTNTVKTQLQKDIADVNNSVTTLDNYVDGAFRDGIISNAEATAIEKYLNTVNAEKTDLDGRYLQIYNNTDLTNATIKTDLYNKKVAYNSAHTNLINSINTAIADGKTTLAEKQDVDSKFASYRTALANLTTAFEKALTSISQKQADTAKTTAINIASTDATNKANSALSSANTYTNNKDTALRDGLNTGAVAVNATGVHGMLAAGKLDIDLAIQTGIPDPAGYEYQGVRQQEANLVTVNTNYTIFMYWTFKHSKRYITFRIAGRWAGERNGQDGMGLITGGRCDYAVATRPYTENIIPGSQGSFSNESPLFNGNSYEQARNITVDIGAPNNGLKFIYLMFKGNLNEPANNNFVHAFLRCLYVAQHD